MFARLIVGILKGLAVGGLIGFGLLKLGFAVPPAILAYIAAALTGIVVGLIAGKPIWAKDAKIEAGMKAFVGALLGAGLMFAVRKWLTMPLMPALPNALGAAEQIKEAGNAVTLGQFSMTSLAVIASVLGGFYDADNTPDEGSDNKTAENKSGSSAKTPTKQRVATPSADEDLNLDDEEGLEDDVKKAKK
jgi:hypothetical protein